MTSVVSRFNRAFRRASLASACLPLLVAACGSSGSDEAGSNDRAAGTPGTDGGEVDAGSDGGAHLGDSGPDAGARDSGLVLFDDAAVGDGAASDRCAADSPDRQGCPCTPGTTRGCYSGPPSTRNVKTCHDGTQTCSGNGEFIAFGPCEGETLPGPGECQTDCAPGDKRCDGQVPQTCDDDSTWSDGAPCAYVCSGGECTGECTPGSRRCDGQVPQTCDDGAWQSGPACPNVCSNGSCDGSCVPGSKQCSDDTPQTCDASGQWQSDSPCSAGQICASGTCGCSAADHRIVGPGGSCICDFSGGYYEVGGQCQKTSSIQDLCSPLPTSCQGVTLPAPAYVFDVDTATLSGTQVKFTSSTLGMIGNAAKFNQVSLGSATFCGRSHKTLNFPAGVGFNHLASLLSSDYSVAVLFRFDYGTCAKSWSRIFDNKDNTIDQGLYMYGSSTDRQLQFYNFSQGAAHSSSNEYAWVAFTKEASTISGYFNRQLQFQYTDSANWSGLAASKNLIYFKDDVAVANEECDGATAKILVFDRALSKAQAECLAF